MALSWEEERRVELEERVRIEERQRHAQQAVWDAEKNEQRANRTPDQRMGTILGWTAIGVLAAIGNIGSKISDLDWNTFWGQFGEMLGTSVGMVVVCLMIGLWRAN